MLYDLNKFRSAKKFVDGIKEILEDLAKCRTILSKHHDKSALIKGLMQNISYSERMFTENLTRARDIVKIKGKE